MSHELRTPLNAIIGFSEILADRTFGDLNDRQLKYANNILNSGHHLLQLINDILDLSKVEAGRLELTRTSFSVAAALQNVQVIVKTLAHKKRLSLEFEVAANLPPLLADEAKFKQIMYNLLSNAIKFTPNGGRVSVAATLADNPSGFSVPVPDLAPPGKCLKVAVTDSGIGIAPQNHERIFLEFEQVDSSYGRQQQGTGLGLALTKRLVEMHGGRIWVESEGLEGKGSTFALVLPLQSAPPELAPPADAPGQPDDTLRPLVLVLTDDPSSQRLIGAYLTEAGYVVAAVSDREKLTGAVKSDRPYAVAVDDQMAQQCDAQELRDLRSRIPARTPAVIFSIEAGSRPGFSLFPGEWAARTPVRPRLIDAVRQTNKSTGKEVKTVLIIEDEVALLEMLAKTLVSKGFHVLQAANGRRGLELATASRPDVIILDLTMPECDGIQVVERLRAGPQTRAIPILIHTGSALNEAERQRLAMHVQSITFKTQPEDLFANLERLDDLEVDAVQPAGIN